MPSERIQRRIDRYLETADEAAAAFRWGAVRENAHAALDLDPENADALTYLAAAERALARTEQAQTGPEPTAEPASPEPAPTARPARVQPTSFVNGRYTVIRFLGEGGKKIVYLCKDTLLNREVAFALIKLEGLDDV
ncbi:MAG: hypothetical protein EXR50_08035, partial [Dehalococcoidia bacterium]|nr:hypothetical protein [Dehalococcoidia bacterium]